MRELRRINGIPASCGIAVGNIKRLTRIDDCIDVALGDILVVPHSSPEWIVALIDASALISEVGGATSHIAIICRELGKPCVTGASAIVDIADGSKISVNGSTGEIIIYESE